MNWTECRKKHFVARLDREGKEIYLSVTHNGNQFTSIELNHREMAIVRDLLSKELERHAEELIDNTPVKIMVGDKVQRNDVLAVYEEEVTPDGMDFAHVYEVESLHKRTIPATYDMMVMGGAKYTTAKLKGLEGEINIDLIDKV